MKNYNTIFHNLNDSGKAEPSCSRANPHDPIHKASMRIGDEEPILSAKGRKKYSRDFLLRFQLGKSSFVRPEGLAMYEDYSAKTVLIFPIGLKFA